MINRDNGSVVEMKTRPFADDYLTNFTSYNNVSWNETGFQVYYDMSFFNEETGWKEYIQFNDETFTYINPMFGQMI